MPGKVTLSLRIENSYELYDTVITEATVTVPAPPDESDADAYNEWASEHIYAETGTGRTNGDSWYDVEITASSLPALVGKTFDFGY